MRQTLYAFAFTALAAPAAGAPLLSLPVDCTLGESCHIQQYMDHDASAPTKALISRFQPPAMRSKASIF